MWGESSRFSGVISESTFPQTIDHLFFYCEVTSKFWFDKVKMETIPPITEQDVLFDVVHFVLLIGKYRIHTCNGNLIYFYANFKCLKKNIIESLKLSMYYFSIFFFDVYIGHLFVFILAPLYFFFLKGILHFFGNRLILPLPQS